MAAIDLTKLEKQIEQLLALAENPKGFQAQFHAILGFYHRYSHRKHKDAMPKSFMLHYDLPEKVLPQLQNRLRAIDPEAALLNARQLWQDEYFEARDTASSLLGQIPISEKEKVFEQFLQWINEPLDRAVVESLFNKAAKTLIEKAPSEWKDLIDRLLLDPKPQQQKMGLFALAKLIPESQSDDLPSFFNWVRPFLINPDQKLDTSLRPVVAALAKRSSQETAYLLREILTDSNDAEVGKRFRHYLEFFESASQKRLLEAIKNQLVLPHSVSNL